MTPSIGDILMLSTLAWKIGCAFTAGRHGAPAEFQQVEKELRGLTGAITMLADVLDDEDSIYARCDAKTQEGLAKVVGCCSQSLNNLEAFVTQYQEIKRSNEGGGMSVQAGWRKVLVRNWKTIKWTIEGGNIDSLRAMLAMHTQSIQLAVQALQTRSLSRLENVIEPMAQQLDHIDGKFSGDLDVKIAEIHHVILSLQAGKTPTILNSRQNSVPGSPTALRGMRPPSYTSERALSPHQYISTPELSDSEVTSSPPTRAGSFMPSSPRRINSQRSSGQPHQDLFYHLDPSPEFDQQKSPKDSAYSTSSTQYKVSPMTQPMVVHSVSSQLQGLNLRLPLPALDTIGQAVQENGNGDSRLPGSIVSSPTTADESVSRKSSYRNGTNGRFTPVSPMTPGTSSRKSSLRADHMTIPPLEPFRRPGTPGGSLSTVADGNEEEDSISARASSLADSVALATTAPSRPSNTNDQRIATVEEQAGFEKGLLENAAVLCEVNAESTDYTIPDEEKPGDFVMKNACGPSKIYLITRHMRLASGKTRFSTSIWIISHDRSVRLQVPLPEDETVIPYTVWNSPCKPIVRNSVLLRFHDTSLDDKPLSSDSTSWLTFTFAALPSSVAFQNALMDKSLLLSVRTKRTMRIFDGLVGSFSFAEQLCGLENLRIVLDPVSGVVSALLHYSPSFSEGYMAFSLNVANECIRVKEEDEKVVRIKGLRIPAGERDKKTGGRRPSTGASLVREASNGKEARGKKEKAKQEWVAGAKIEFSSSADKEQFMAKLREIQDMGAVRP